MMRSNDPPALSVRLLATPETTPFALYGLMEVMGSVGVAWSELTGEPSGAPRFEVGVVAQDGAPFRAALGVPVAPDESFADGAPCDLVLVPDMALSPDADPRGRWTEAAAWLRERHAEGARVCSVCSGALLLAEAGLLDGRAATTHWAFAPMLARFYPQVRVLKDRVIVPADPEGRVVTGGGASAWEDLAVWLVARFSGAEEAVRIRKLFLFGDRRDGQLPFAALLPRPSGADAAVAAAQEWAADHYPERLAASGMAAAAGLAPRSFARRFRAATGFSPLEYLQTLRIEEAKQMLERTDLPSDEIAAEVGYEDPAHFRRVFRRLAGVTPGAYRQRWRAPAG